MSGLYLFLWSEKNLVRLRKSSLFCQEVFPKFHRPFSMKKINKIPVLCYKQKLTFQDFGSVSSKILEVVVFGFDSILRFGDLHFTKNIFPFLYFQTDAFLFFFTAL